MSVRPRTDSVGREPKEHCLTLDDRRSGLAYSNSIDKCDTRQSVDTATSPVSFKRCKLADILEVNSKSTRDILGRAKEKLLEACSALQADYEVLISFVKQIETNDRRAENIDFDCDVIKLNVGGHVFDTSVGTLNKFGTNLFTGLFSGKGEFKKNADGYYFFDRDGVHFRHILNYMRHGTIPEYIIRQCKHELLTEAEFYGIRSLVDYLNEDNVAAAKNEANVGSNETCSCVQTQLRSPGIIDEATGLLNKACLSLDEDISHLDVVDHQRYKAALCLPDQSNDVIKLNVGGVFFQTNLATLMKDKDSLLVSLVTGKLETCQNNDGFFYIDRDGTRFRHILNFLRDGEIPEKVYSDMGDELMIEADFFEIGSLKRALNLLMHKKFSSKLQNSPGNETINCHVDDMSENNIRKSYKKQLFDGRGEDCFERQEENYQNITRKIDSLIDMFDSQMSQFKDCVKESTAGKDEKIDIMVKRTENIERTVSDLSKENIGMKLQEVCRDCKSILSDSYKGKSDEIIDIKSHISDTLLQHINQYKDRSKSTEETHSEIKQLISRTLQSGFDRNSGKFGQEVVKFETSMKKAFQEHEFRMEQELIAHKLPTLCAFGMSEILRKDNESKSYLHQFLIETRNTGKVKFIYSKARHGEENFHTFCDRKPPTLILVKDDYGNIFGGFTTKYWNRDHGKLNSII